MNPITMHLPDVRESDLMVSRITQKEMSLLTDFCENCSAFFEMTEGKKEAEKIATEIVELLPPGKDDRNRHLLGFSRNGALVAVADLAEDYPDTNDWYVALLVVLPSARQAGLGSRIWARIESWIGVRGGQDISLIVQQQNPRARHFWESHGFAVVDMTIQRLPDRNNRIWRMRRPG